MASAILVTKFQAEAEARSEAHHNKLIKEWRREAEVCHHNSWHHLGEAATKIANQYSAS